MDRHEAVLRELNMYPLWVRRDVVVVNSAQDTHRLNTPSPLVGEGRGEGGTENSTLSLALPPQGGGDELAVVPSKIKATGKSFQINSNLSWPELKSAVHSCQACALRAGCSQTVFGVGAEKADWLFIGEAPGEEEDASGEPFVGAAGKLLENMLLALKLKRSNVYIANVIKCRPPEDRSPHVGEIAQCLPYLQRQIALIQPKVIVALGKVASNALLGNDATLASLRGTPHNYQGIPLIVTYHPSYLLRSPMEKAKAWQDLC
ncbi:MAG: uracil-DNA glycosylase, partial [Gallionella sp.]|nr:uracil-DNA glycosylase [Gallionella sp.]